MGARFSAVVLTKTTTPVLAVLFCGWYKLISQKESLYVYVEDVHDFIKTILEEEKISYRTFGDLKEDIRKAQIFFDKRYIESITTKEEGNHYVVDIRLKENPVSFADTYRVHSPLRSQEVLVWALENIEMSDFDTTVSADFVGGLNLVMDLLSETFPTWQGVFDYVKGEDLDHIKLRQLITVLRQFYTPSQEIGWKGTNSIFQTYSSALFDYLVGHLAKRTLKYKEFEYQVHIGVSSEPEEADIVFKLGEAYEVVKKIQIEPEKLESRVEKVETEEKTRKTAKKTPKKRSRTKATTIEKAKKVSVETDPIQAIIKEVEE